MKLIRARVTDYKSIDDSGWVDFADVTCLVGKNESGKTAFLQALTKLRPYDKAVGKFEPILEYPKKRYSKYKSEHERNPADVVEAEFEVETEDVAAVSSVLGQGALNTGSLVLQKGYDNIEFWRRAPWSEQAMVKHAVESASLGPDATTTLGQHKTIDALRLALEADDDKTQAATNLLEHLKTTFPRDYAFGAIKRLLEPRLPRFVYFDEYSVLPGEVVIEQLSGKSDPTESERTFLALLELVNANLDDFLDGSNYEKLKAELEAASSGITDQVFEYWSQNKNLEVEFDIQTVDSRPQAKETHLHIRIKNRKHRVTVPFTNRSRGFVWFFSFLAYFSSVEGGSENLILLLDEPGLNLHATAQGDFLRFIEERLAPRHQVIYSTHSPFMIQAGRLDRVRTVEDTEDKGTVVSADVLRTDRDTVFPLQAALGYDMAQTLFLGPNCLLVEGPSDLLYLQVLSEACARSKRESLDPRWVVTPVGGADRLSAFVSLIGSNALNAVVLMDVTPSDQQRVEALVGRGLLERQKVLTVGQFLGSRNADVEDLFDPAFYLKLFNKAYGRQFGKAIAAKDVVQGDPRILKRIEGHLRGAGLIQGRVDHYKPAAYLLKQQLELVPEIDDATLDRFASLFTTVNALAR